MDRVTDTCQGPPSVMTTTNSLYTVTLGMWQLSSIQAGLERLRAWIPLLHYQVSPTPDTLYPRHSSPQPIWPVEIFTSLAETGMSRTIDDYDSWHGGTPLPWPQVRVILGNLSSMQRRIHDGDGITMVDLQLLLFSSRVASGGAAHEGVAINVS
jgi:hypothetical protein